MSNNPRAPYTNELIESQEKAAEVLTALGYEEITSEEAFNMRGSFNNVLLEDVLKERLKAFNSFESYGQRFSFSDSTIEEAVRELKRVHTNNLITNNKEIYDLLTLGKSFPEITHVDGVSRRLSYTLNYIDWDNPTNNTFQFVREFKVEKQKEVEGQSFYADEELSEDAVQALRKEDKHHAIPDIVLFVNGIPLGVIECKHSSVRIENGISQMIRNQEEDYIPQLFKFSQILMAVSRTGAKYATTATKKKFWSVWKEQDESFLNAQLEKVVNGRRETEQDKALISLFHPNRLMELMRFFILYDNNVKKIARYQQYFAVKAILATVSQRNSDGDRHSGVIWHTQGSGKSLTMVMLAKYIEYEFKANNPRVVIVTDRINLDKQIHSTFNHSRIKTARASTGRNLIDLIEDESNNVITTLVHKFDTASSYDKQFRSQDIFILVDESHRSQYGEMHFKMRKVFPNACYIGFTGTPLMKKEKSTMERFGRLIHAYTIKDGVEDKVIVPLIYEGKLIEQTPNDEGIDEVLNNHTQGLSDEQREELKQKWSRMDAINSSKTRIIKVAMDINRHFLNNFKTEESLFKGMVVAASRREAVLYHEAFKTFNKLETAIAISEGDNREGYDEPGDGDRDEIKAFFKKVKQQYSSVERYEESIKNRFVNGDDLDLLIVVDKLLTGFDAPRATVLYIDKPMKNHNLLQAIARVNRQYEGKDYGFIVDYRGLIKPLNEAMTVYSGAGLEKFVESDIAGVLRDVLTLVSKLKSSFSVLKSMFAGIQNTSELQEYEDYLVEPKMRKLFYKRLSEFSKNLAYCLQSQSAYEAIGEDAIKRYKQYLKFYQKLRRSLIIIHFESVNYKEYEPLMRILMDNYIVAGKTIQVTEPVNILDTAAVEEELNKLESDKSKAEAIGAKISKSISQRMDENPVLFKKFYDSIKKTIEDYKTKRLSEAQYLEEMRKHQHNYVNLKDNTQYPAKIKNNPHAKVLYGLLKQSVSEHMTNTILDSEYANLSDAIVKSVEENIRIGYRNSDEVKNKLEQIQLDLLYRFFLNNGIDPDFEMMEKTVQTLIVTILERDWGI